MICPHCRKHFSLVCQDCGYDPGTAAPKLSRADFGLEDHRGPQADIWIGAFPDEAAFNEYFEEGEDREEDEPVSRFAEEQGIGFYDHDFFATWFGVDNIDTVCREMFSDNMDLSEIRAAVSNSPRTSFNAVAMQVDELGDMGLLRSVEGEGCWLHYLGRFEYEPRHG